MTDKIQAIMAATENAATLAEFFAGIASGEYYDGTSWQLYLDADDDTLMIHQEVSDQSWIQRDDGSLVRIVCVSGYCDIPENERYTEGCDLQDYGFSDWLDEIEARIAQALEA